MGAADVVPGVSGGTIAFISGIYEELISSISKINLQALKVLTQEGIVAFWKYINGSFFLALLMGIGISIISLAKVMKFLLENHPIIVWSFFFGLMVASVLFLMKEIERWNFGSIMVMLLAMILPGISGAFILVLLGAYHTVLDALSSWNFKIILIFGIGALTGILSFSKALKWLFAKYRNLTFAGLTGFIIGSLNKVWPWKETLQTDPLNGSVIHEKSVLPSTFEMITHNDAQVVTALLLAIVGFFVIYGIEKWSNLQKS